MIGEHINIKTEMLANSLNIKTAASFMNKVIHKDKEGYYKMLVWFKSKDISLLKNFNINFFMNVNDKRAELETSKYDKNFEMDHNVLAVKIPAEMYSDQMQINYVYTYNGYYEGKGHIKINLNLQDEKIIDNEVLIFDDQEKWSIVRHVENVYHPFFYNQRYSNLFNIKYKTIVQKYFKIPNKETEEMVDNVLNEVYAKNFNFNKLEIVADNPKKYDFKPSVKMETKNDLLAINLDNNLFIDESKQIIQEGGTQKGMLFNPYNNGGQYINLNYELFGKKYFVNFKLEIPKIDYEKLTN
ncbi:hypothetical protein ELUMI_v1c03220 [Williamsoniiplasma luminosum]|uniref:Uncharacterized protein n=1 Tax=Williamsoniiplasma luminosum TaxID=214888 RepID=A0A2K8NTF7_9MOLU|nr:hypothetical protein [Williamsoniiplasma luminosum]ATZ17047.1 hypothetical protein ELUMI_v1c03220 [Williamsoniiplasma luminosum]